MRKINNDAREKPGLRHAEKKPRPIKLARGVHHADDDSGNTPGNQDARDPAARAPFLHQQRAGDFEEKISDKKNPRAKAEDLRAETEVPGHAERGIGHVDPVEEGNDVEDEQIRQQTPRDPPARARAHLR